MSTRRPSTRCNRGTPRRGGDGSIRADLGNPYLTAVTLWGFMHGIIQIAATKANMMAADGVSTQQLIDHALRMSSLGLSPKDVA